jgi:hypothetical protein
MNYFKFIPVLGKADVVHTRNMRGFYEEPIQ